MLQLQLPQQKLRLATSPPHPLRQPQLHSLQAHCLVLNWALFKAPFDIIADNVALVTTNTALSSTQVRLLLGVTAVALRLAN
jgi:hypothetical protein